MKRIILVLLLFAIVFSLACINAQENDTSSTAENQTAENMSAMQEIVLNDLMPKEVQLGDVEFTLQIRNTENETVKNIFAFISGDGISSYNVIPVDSLPAGEEGVIFVFGNAKKAGNISVTIRINDETFYQNITVIDPNNETEQKLEEVRKAQEKEQQIQNISDNLNRIKARLIDLEDELAQKKDDGYDVSQITLDYLQSYIRKIQADILTGDVGDATINLNLADQEYSTIKDSLDYARKVPFINKLKDYALIFSTIAGSIITFFALYELLKKKRENISDVITKKMVKKKPEEKESKKE
jgi:hypothetical protein